MDKFTPEYIQNVQQIIKNDEKDKARELLKDLHPADIAELYQQLNLDEAEYIYMLLDGEKAADVLLELDEDDRENKKHVACHDHVPLQVSFRVLQSRDTDRDRADFIAVCHDQRPEIIIPVSDEA